MPDPWARSGASPWDRAFLRGPVGLALLLPGAGRSPALPRCQPRALPAPELPAPSAALRTLPRAGYIPPWQRSIS